MSQLALIMSSTAALVLLTPDAGRSSLYPRRSRCQDRRSEPLFPVGPEVAGRRQRRGETSCNHAASTAGLRIGECLRSSLRLSVRSVEIRDNHALLCTEHAFRPPGRLGH